MRYTGIPLPPPPPPPAGPEQGKLIAHRLVTSEYILLHVFKSVSLTQSLSNKITLFLQLSNEATNLQFWICLSN